MKENKTNRIAMYCFGIAAILLLFCSCLSFDIGDWPSRYVHPHNDPTENLCGPIGAFCAYFLLYYIGPGIFVIFAAAAGLFIAALIGRTVEQMVFRVMGLVLLTVAASGSFYCFWPNSIYEFPLGSGGLLGIAAATFLQNHFAALGTFILFSATWLVGLILLADSFVLTVFKTGAVALIKAVGIIAPTWAAARQQSRALGGIWRRLSVKQKLLQYKPTLFTSRNAGELKQESHIATVVETREQNFFYVLISRFRYIIQHPPIKYVNIGWH